MTGTQFTYRSDIVLVSGRDTLRVPTQPLGITVGKDVDEADLAKLDTKLQAKVDMIFDGLTKTKQADGREVVCQPGSTRQLLQTLFTVSGINHAIPDDAVITNQTITMHLKQTPIKDALAVLAERAHLTLHYSAGVMRVTKAVSAKP